MISTGYRIVTFSERMNNNRWPERILKGVLNQISRCELLMTVAALPSISGRGLRQGMPVSRAVMSGLIVLAKLKELAAFLLSSHLGSRGCRA